MSVGDPHFDFVSCLMHFDGPNNGLRIYDERHNVVTLFGNAKLTTAQSKFGGTSGLFVGVGSRVTMSNTAVADCSNTATIEGWLYFDSISSSTNIVYQTYTNTGSMNGHSLFVTSNGGVAVYAREYYVINPTSTAGAITPGVWTHFALVFLGMSVSIYINGGFVASGTFTLIRGLQPSDRFCIGGDIYGNPLAGYLDEFRITKGIARYTTNFTPPAAPFPNYGSSGPRTDPDYDKVVLHCHFDGEPGSTTFVDQKGNALTRTAGSLSTTRPMFGGSGGDSAAFLASSSDFDLGDSDFTIEWFQGYDSSLFYDIESFSFQSTGGSWGALSYTMQYGATMRVRLNGVAVISPGTGIGANTSSMFHFAVVRQSSTLALFANGVRHGTYEIGSGAIDTNGTVRFQGSSPARFVDEFRFTKGAARYPVSSPTYAVPTEPFPDYALQKLTGTVLDDEGNPLARTVRSFRSSDGLLIDTQVSDATTGAFELRATDTTPHFVVVQDPEKNALIFDHITPVI